MSSSVLLRAAGALTLACVLGACSPYALTSVPSENQGSRIRQLVLHFTSENYAEARRLLTEPTAYPVSAHYLVPEPGDPTWGRERVVVHRLVPEARRAWHAGASSWDGETALNNSSIGIEIVNVSRCEPAPGVVEPAGPEDEVCRFLPYPEAQLEAVLALARDILARNPDIEPWRVVGHSDVAPARKADP
ncbi:MAG: N-acetylmuramoyl-L-alanine amidase, partial [Pseudomonadales bacterium]|nr:N-acetylmuramoyl-L-alanine amidase [Pseudomonadales bacterium]